MLQITCIEKVLQIKNQVRAKFLPVFPPLPLCNFAATATSSPSHEPKLAESASRAAEAMPSQATAPPAESHEPPQDMTDQYASSCFNLAHFCAYSWLNVPQLKPSRPSPSNRYITMEIMRDPVVAVDGFTCVISPAQPPLCRLAVPDTTFRRCSRYERTSIEKWFASGKRISPATGGELSSKCAFVSSRILCRMLLVSPPHVFLQV